MNVITTPNCRSGPPLSASPPAQVQPVPDPNGARDQAVKIALYLFGNTGALSADF